MNESSFKRGKISSGSFLNASRQLIKSSSNDLKRRKFSGLMYHNNSKCHSRNSSCTKKNKSKSKSRQGSKNNQIIDKMLFLQYETKRYRKSRPVKIMHEAIKFKEKDNIKGSRLFSKTQKLKAKEWVTDGNKENEMRQNKGNSQKYILNKQLLKSSLKPNKVNYMNRVSNVYDLVLSRVMLPPFVQYFLGEALYVINKESKMSGSMNADVIYDWKLDEFKRICQKIYETSEQQDLKHFMGLSLPTISRWNSKINSTKNAASIPINTLITTHEDSRISNGLSNTSYNNNDRVGYFRSLNKRDRVSIGQQKQSIDIIDKLNSKLDNYLKSNYNKLESHSQKPNLFQLPLKCQNKASINFSNLPQKSTRLNM